MTSEQNESVDGNFSTYNKKQILARLKQTNCNPNKTHLVDSRFLHKNVKDFIDTRAKVNQAKINEAMAMNKPFLNLTKCVADLSESGAAHLTDNTLPATLAAIAEFESHPETNEVNGIDLKRLYTFLANLMAGYPTEDLEEGPTKEFLHKCYGNLMQHTNPIPIDELRQHLNEDDERSHPVYSWLCNSNYNQYSAQMFRRFDK